MNTIARRLVVRGRVQGVGYRDAAVQAAFTCGVAGWVRNLADGAVEAWVQGAPEAVERFIVWSWRGPPLARVADVDVAEALYDPSCRDFQWRPTQR